ncbi:prepilin peptidase [uncultured Sphingomonas sp.]|uniref:prepilin peptidase n=1 Tax=uncultured Sphingomonas sp. TaxID=158754 RepID=UPI0035CAAA91
MFTSSITVSLLLASLGAILGSFLATLVVRWPEDRSVLTGRSACDSCGRTLVSRELIPLVSALASRGRCRSCGARIDSVHWRIELACALVGLSAGLIAPDWRQALAGGVFGWLLVTLAALDWRAFWLPDRITAALALAGVASGAAGLAPEPLDRLIGGAGGFAGLWLIARGYRLLRGRDGMGGGDPKLFGAIGLWLGWRMLPSVLLIAGLAGLGGVLFRRLTGRPVARDDALPLGALLAAAAYPAWLVMVGLAL